MKDLEIRWRQDYEFSECFEHGSKRKKLDKPIWVLFDINDISYRSRDYCIQLFSNGTPVLIREGNQYVTNNLDVYNQYKQAGRNVTRLDECKPSTRAVIDAGFLKGAINE
jgi:hypothetical protein